MATSSLVYESIRAALKYHSLGSTHSRNVFSQCFRLEVQDGGGYYDYYTFNIWQPSILFLVVTAQFCIPINSGKGFRFIPSLANVCCLLWFLVITILACARLCHLHVHVHGEVEHLFTCGLAICMPSLEKCLFRSSGQFLNWVIGFGTQLQEFL